MRSALVCLCLLAAIPVGASAARRSLGYAGSTPVGLIGYTAFLNGTCSILNADRRRSFVKVPLLDDCATVIPAPDGRAIARTMVDGESTTLHVTGGLIVRGLSQPTIFRWRPDARGFFLNGGEGSGQVSHLRYFYRTPAGWFESRRLVEAASNLYRRRYDCRGGGKSYTNTSGWDWPRGSLRVIVQEGVHSEGCRQPYTDRNVLFEVIGDPITGRITTAREIDTLR